MLYQRSLEAPELPSYFLTQLRVAARKRETDFYHHYDIEEGWSECALHTATEKGMVHRCVDRCISYIPLFKWLYVRVRVRRFLTPYRRTQMLTGIAFLYRVLTSKAA
jgi:hypothetical protein